MDSGDPSAGASGQAINYVTGASYGPDNALTGFTSGQSSGFEDITMFVPHNPAHKPSESHLAVLAMAMISKS